MHRLQPLLHPHSIALIGASEHPARIGGMPLDHMRHFSYRGQVYPINPKYSQVMGYPCYPSIESVPQAPDLVVLAIAAADVVPMLRRCHQKGARAAIIYAAGFAEAGGDGVELQAELEAYVEDTGMVVAGPNCMGFANLNLHAYTAFASVFRHVPAQAEPGRVSVITQSGNVCSAVFGLIRGMGIPVSHFVNTGNEACLEFSQYLDFMAQDSATDCVVGYVEQLRDGPRFIEAALSFARQDKPLVLYKVGESQKGIEAVRSHTAALAGDIEVYHTAFNQLNVIGSNDLAQMADLAYLSGFRHRSGGTRLAVVTMSGALGAILADKLAGAGLEIPDLPPEVQNSLRQQLPDYSMVSNPIDLSGNIVNQPEVLQNVLTALSAAEVIDVVVVYAPGYLLDRMADQLVSAALGSGRLFVAIDTGAAECRARLAKSGIPVFTDIGRATRALAPYCHWMARRGEVAEWAQLRSTPLELNAPAITRDADEVKIRQWLASIGVKGPNEKVATTMQEAIEYAPQLGFPLALKILSPDIAHKTEAGGVKLGLSDSESVHAAYDQIMKSARAYDDKARLDGVLLQNMVTDGVLELIVGVTRDPVFGLMLTVGLGGVLTELYRDTSHRLLPVTEDMAADMLQELRVWPLFNGFRGSPRADIHATCVAITAISRAALVLGDQLSELEVNPLLVRAEGQGALALDTLIIWAQDESASKVV